MVVKEAAEITGRIVAIAKLGQELSQVVVENNHTHTLTKRVAALAIGSLLKEYLLEPIDVILHGTGEWKQCLDGWNLNKLHISSFEKIDFSAIKTPGLDHGSRWPDDLAEAEKLLLEIRYGDD